MKPIFIFFLIASMMLFTCVGNDSIDIHNKQFNLIAPNGEKICNSIEDLNNWTSKVILEKFGTYKKFEISSVTYFDVKIGFCAFIKYKYNNNKEGSYILFNSLPKNMNEGRQQVACIRWSGSCSGDSCCTPSYNTATSTYSCSCSSGGTGCTLTLTCIETY